MHDINFHAKPIAHLYGVNGKGGQLCNRTNEKTGIVATTVHTSKENYEPITGTNIKLYLRRTLVH